MTKDVEITLDPGRNCFVIRIADQTILVPPRQFERLLEEAIAAAAKHIDAHLQETGSIQKNEPGKPVEALVLTDMDAGADLGARQILTKMHIGPLALNFACPRSVAIDYCEQVMHILQSADATSEGPLS
jgi:hypothetical protein